VSIEQPRRRLPAKALFDDEPAPADGVPVLYFHWDKIGNCLYIGQTFHFKNRQSRHRERSKWWDEILYIDWDTFPSLSRRELLAEEADRIKNIGPKYNVAGR
jgi:excinuclease UvrABC nuclease subunit